MYRAGWVRVLLLFALLFLVSILYILCITMTIFMLLSATVLTIRYTYSAISQSLCCIGVFVAARSIHYIMSIWLG